MDISASLLIASQTVLWFGDLVLGGCLLCYSVVSECALELFESVLRVLPCTRWLTGVTKGCPQHCRAQPDHHVHHSMQPPSEHQCVTAEIMCAPQARTSALSSP